MARQYKANRARGTRKSKYATKYELGFALPKIKDFRGIDQYVEEFVKLNKKETQEAYQKHLESISRVGGEKAVSRFKKSFPSVKAYVKSQFKTAIETSEKQRFSLKIVKEVAGKVLAPTSLKQMNHILNLISRDEDFYEEFRFRANEEIDVNRLLYTKDNTYRYTTKSGKVIKFAFLEYGSPSRLEFFGEEENE